MNKPRVIDLFCGAGGFSHGFQMAGFEIVLGVDNWKGCEETFRHNHEGADFQLKDINELDPHDLPQVDVIIGSPPCTEFSVVNVRKDESKGFVLIDAFLGIVEALEPDYWIMENVPNKKLVEYLSDYPKMVVRCSDFGLRTMRRRLFAGKFPQPISMGSREWRLKNGSKVYPSVGTSEPSGWIKHKDDRVFHLRKPWKDRGVVFGSVPANPRRGAGEFAYQHESWERRGVVFPTVVGCNVAQRGATGGKQAFNKRGIDTKTFTPEFAAWVQTFPKSFKFFGSKTARYKMIGNAVPPEMAYILANAIREDIEEASS